VSRINYLFWSATLILTLTANVAAADENWSSTELVARCQAALHTPDGSSGKAMCVNTVGYDALMSKCMTPDPKQEDFAAIVDWLARNPTDGEDEMDGVARAERALYGCVEH